MMFMAGRVIGERRFAEMIGRCSKSALLARERQGTLALARLKLLRKQLERCTCLNDALVKVFYADE